MSTPEIEAEALVESTGALWNEAQDERPDLPPLYQDKSFWGMTITQFLGAFNDNLFKQLVIFLSVITVGSAAITVTDRGAQKEVPVIEQGVPPDDIPVSGAGQDSAAPKVEDKQGTADTIFGIPFLLVTGYAGYLADRYSKRTIIISCKVAEIFIMAAGAVAFSLYTPGHLGFLYVVLFLMGTHSGFFGPAKYGILPEILRQSDLPRANGFILMTTFLSIILGGVLAGVLKEHFAARLWVASVAGMSIAAVGAVTSLWVRKIPPSNPTMKFEWSSLAVPPDMVAMLRANRPLMMAVLVSSVFWMLAGMMKSAITAAGLIDQRVGEEKTSYLFAMISVGIAVGAAVGGLISRTDADFRVFRIGAIGMLACMILLAIPSGGDAANLLGPDGKLLHVPGFAESRHWLGYLGSMGVVTLLGVFTGFFAVPLQVYMQKAPPEGKKGRMIAVMNQANWIGIVLNGVVYSAIAQLIEANEWPRCTAFIFIAAIMLPIVLFYHPKNDPEPAAA
jgi:acyl-[acyl-carrier-protein]-phospholipid O-acyltransferase/long-chain-fatty-acid--[acyl-carrier-protein] ligase